MTCPGCARRRGGVYGWLAAVAVLAALTAAPSLASAKVDSHREATLHGLRAGPPVPTRRHAHVSAQGETIYTFSGARLYSCDASGCQAIDTLDGDGNDGIFAVVSGNGWVYAADSNGTIWRCDPAGVNNCNPFDSTGVNFDILSLAYGGGRLYAGRSDGVIWNCDANNPNHCLNLDDDGGDASINALAYSNGRLFAGRGDGVIWSCDANNPNHCLNLDTDGGFATGGLIYSLAFSNDGSRLYSTPGSTATPKASGAAALVRTNA
jgi:hypothetical protein